MDKRSKTIAGKEGKEQRNNTVDPELLATGTTFFSKGQLEKDMIQIHNIAAAAGISDDTNLPTPKAKVDKNKDDDLVILEEKY